MIKVNFETSDGYLIKARCEDIDTYGEVEDLSFTVLDNDYNETMLPDAEMQDIEDMVIEKLVEKKYYPDLYEE